MKRSFVLEESTGYLVNRVATLMTVGLERELSQHGITAGQWAVLAILANEPPMAMVPLAARLGVDVGAVSRLVDRLEAKKLVVRNRLNDDRRVVRVSMTPTGNRLFPKLPELAKSVLDQALAPLSPQEIAVLNDLLRRILAKND